MTETDLERKLSALEQRYQELNDIMAQPETTRLVKRSVTANKLRPVIAVSGARRWLPANTH